MTHITMNQEVKKKAVILFIKYPEKGKVKTRLASTTNNKFAVNIYRSIAENIFCELDNLDEDIDVFVFYSAIENFEKITSWVGKPFNYKVQAGSDLGEKMSNAFEDVFSLNYSSSVIIGSDVPDITSDVIMDAFNNLENHDVVISPSDDGGYSLLGINNIHKELFRNISWSSKHVLVETLEIIKNGKLKFSLLESLNDIDTEEELKIWLSKSENSNLKEKIISIMERER